MREVAPTLGGDGRYWSNYEYVGETQRTRSCPLCAAGVPKTIPLDVSEYPVDAFRLEGQTLRFVVNR